MPLYCKPWVEVRYHSIFVLTYEAEEVITEVGNLLESWYVFLIQNAEL